MAGSMVGGCALVGPDFFAPAAPQMSRWLQSEVALHEQYSGVTERRGPSEAWWTLFKDPTLNTLVAKARAQNLTLEAAGIRIFQARAELGIVIGDKYPQSQTLGGEYKRERISKDTGLAKQIDKVVDFNPTFQTWQTGFDAAWELDIWGQFRRGVESASANLVAQIANYDDVLVTLTGDVATAYVTIRALQQELVLVRRNVSTQTQSLNLTQLRFKNGVTTDLDVQEATALLNNTKALIPPLESDQVKAKNALAVLLGTTPAEIGKYVDRPGSIPRPPAEVGVGIPADLIRRRPDIRAAEMRAARQSAQIGVAKADLYPAFGISGAIGLKSTDIGDLFSGKSVTGLISPGFTWNILNYGRIRNNVRVQDAKFQETIASYKNTVLKAFAEVENALVAFLNAKREAVYLARSVEASRAGVRIANDQYRDGTADYSRVLNTEQALLHAEERLAQVRADVVTNLIAVYKGLGGGWQSSNFGPLIPDSTKQEMAARTNWGKLLQPQAISPSERELQVPPSPRERPNRRQPDW